MEQLLPWKPSVSPAPTPTPDKGPGYKAKPRQSWETLKCHRLPWRRQCGSIQPLHSGALFFSETSQQMHMALMLSILISQMKELGVIFYNCSCLVLDLQRIFALYSSLKFKSRVPQTWSKRLYGVYDNEKKLQLQLNETKSQAFVSVSCSLSPPPLFSSRGPVLTWNVRVWSYVGKTWIPPIRSVPFLEAFKSVPLMLIRMLSLMIMTMINVNDHS